MKPFAGYPVTCYGQECIENLQYIELIKDDLRVREVLLYARNKGHITANLFNGFGIPFVA